MLSSVMPSRSRSFHFLALSASVVVSPPPGSKVVTELTFSHINTERKKEDHSSACVSLQEPEGSPGRDILLFIVGENWVTGHVTMP